MDDGAPRRAASTQCVLLASQFCGQNRATRAPAAGALSLVAGRPFLAYLLWHARRFGFLRAVVLVQDDADAETARGAAAHWSPGIDVEVVVIPGASGTAGALRRVAEQLDPCFMLIEARSLFDFNWLDLLLCSSQNPAASVWMSTRAASEPDGGPPGPGSVPPLEPRAAAGGVYLVDREVALACPTSGSFEFDVLPEIAAKGQVIRSPQGGFFLDMTAPGALEAAQHLVPASLERGAVFFDRDGVLNVDRGYTHRWSDFEWVDGAIEAVKKANDRNLFVFVATNQSGVARGYYEETAVGLLHRQMQEALRARGAHVDDFRYCPHHPDGVLTQYARVCDWRKPGPGMLLDIAQHWPVKLSRSFMVGDSLSDLEAAKAAGVRGVLFGGGRLDDALSAQLAVRTERP